VSSSLVAFSNVISLSLQSYGLSEFVSSSIIMFVIGVITVGSLLGPSGMCSVYAFVFSFMRCPLILLIPVMHMLHVYNYNLNRYTVLFSLLLLPFIV
jgi:hypothetical protein